MRPPERPYFGEGVPLATPVQPIAGRYQAIREERSSPQARLVRAKDLQADAEVSIWIIRPTLPPDRLAHFGAEADRAHRVIFDGMRPVLDHGIDQGRAFAVVPALVGETLGQVMRARRGPTGEDALELIREVAQTLTQAHRHGLMHGYLRPDDIVLTGSKPVLDGVGLWPALGMLGVAEHFGTDARFLAPEVRGGTPPSTRADVYGLAVIGALLLDVPLDSPHLAECLAERPAERAAAPTAVPVALARALRGQPEVEDERGTQPHVRADAGDVLTFYPRPTGSPLRVAAPSAGDSVTPEPIEVAARGTPHHGLPLSPSLLRPVTQAPPRRPTTASSELTRIAPPPSLRLIVLAMITVGIFVGAVTVIAGSLATDRAVEGMRAELRTQLKAELRAELVEVIQATAPPPVVFRHEPAVGPVREAAVVAPVAGGCPHGTVRVPGRPVCIDRLEAVGPAGAPRVAITLRDARAACETRGMTLCAAGDWEAACRGPGGASYPYGADRRASACNTGSGTIETPGTRRDCASASGAFDMAGNVAEWVAEGSVRGGSALRDHDGRCSRVERRPDDGVAEDLGFRCCVATE